MAFFIQNSIRGKSLHTTEFISVGEIITHLNKEKVSKDMTYQSIQIENDLHFMPDEFFSNMNHSCDPAAIIDTMNYVIIANRDIYPGEEINFFYPSTEWKMMQPFHCQCGAEDCLKYIEGAYQLPIRYLQIYFINDHIKGKIFRLVDDNHHNYRIIDNKKVI